MKSSHGRREGFWWPHSDEDLYNLPMPHEVDDIFSVLELAGAVLPSSLLQGAAWQAGAERFARALRCPGKNASQP